MMDSYVIGDGSGITHSLSPCICHGVYVARQQIAEAINKRSKCLLKMDKDAAPIARHLIIIHLISLL